MAAPQPAPGRSFAHSVMYDGLYTLVVRLLNMACAAALGILTARLLGPSGKGVFALPGVEAAMIVPALQGLNGATSYYMLNRRVGGSILVTGSLVALVFLLAGAFVLIPIGLAASARWAIVPAIAWLPSQAAINLATGYTIGIKRVRYATTLTVVTTSTTLAFMAIGLFLVARSAFIAVDAWIAGYTVVGAIAFAGVAIHAGKMKGTERVGVGEFARFAWKVGLVNLIARLNYRADVYIIAVMTSTAVLGMYTVAVSAAESLLVPTQVAALVTTPHIGSLEERVAARLAARCVRNNMLVAFVVCGTLFAVAYPIVHFLYGDAFLALVPALRVLLVGVFALSLSSPLSTYFTIKLGKPEVPLWLAAVSAVLCIAAAIALVPHLGMIGAATASTAAYVLGQAAAIWYFSKTTGIKLGAMLLPTGEDFSIYAGFARRVCSDTRRVVRAIGWGVSPH